MLNALPLDIAVAATFWIGACHIESFLNRQVVLVWGLGQCDHVTNGGVNELAATITGCSFGLLVDSKTFLIGCQHGSHVMLLVDVLSIGARRLTYGR